jgi:hypothetical protein
MKQFTLSKQPRGDQTTRFHVVAADDSVCGIITVQNSDADDLERHWLGASPQAKAAAATTSGKETSAAASMVAAFKRQGASPRATTAGKENPAVNAMLAAAKKHRLSQAAILRGC